MLVQRSVFSLLLVGLIAGLVAQAQDATHEHESAQLPKLGVAVITPTKGNKVRGVLRLVQKGDEIKITGRVTQLAPGEHGFHIHEFGDLCAYLCSEQASFITGQNFLIDGGAYPGTF